MRAGALAALAVLPALPVLVSPVLVPPAAAMPGAASPRPAAARLVAAETTTGATGATSSPVSVEVTRLAPTTLTPAATLVIRGAVVSRSPEAISGLTVSLHLGSAIEGRGQLHALRAQPVPQPLAAPQQKLGDQPLAPGQRRPFSLSVPAAALELTQAGVYPLQVTAVGRLPSGYRDLGTASTALPYLPKPASHRLRIAAIVPLTAAPALAGEGALTDQLVETRLRRELSSGGRLAGLLDAAASRGTTPAVDPALVETVQTLGAAHRLGQSPVVRPGAAEARAWLARLRALVARVSPIRLPYGNPDVEAAAHAGVPELVQEADSRGERVLRQALGTPGQTQIGLPPGGAVDTAGLDLMATRLGTHTVVLRGDSVSATPGIGVVSITGRAEPGRALLTDPALTALLDAGPGAAPVLAEQDIVAECALAALDTPDAPSAALVITLPSSGSGSGAQATWPRRVVADLAAMPLLAPVGLGTLAGAVPGASVTPHGTTDSTTRGTSSSSAGGTAGGTAATPLAPELPPSVLDGVRRIRADVADLRTALPAVQSDDEACPTSSQTRDELITDPACRAMLLSVSAEWRQAVDEPPALPGGGLAGSQAQQALASALLDELRSQVRAVASHEVALTSRTGRVPVTLENNLREPVRVTLVLGTADRASVQSGTAVERTVRPGQKVQVDIEVRAVAAGTFPVALSLLTPGGRPFGAPSQVLVRSTAYGVLAVALTVGALAVLVLAVLYRAARGLWRRRAGAGG